VFEYSVFKFSFSEEREENRWQGKFQHHEKDKFYFSKIYLLKQQQQQTNKQQSFHVKLNPSKFIILEKEEND